MNPLGTQKPTQAGAVVPFYVTGAAMFLILTILLFFSASKLTIHYFQPHILAITHLATLGWGTMVVFGASNQLLPVVLQTPLHSEKIAKWSYFFLLPGVILLALSFWLFNTGLMMQIAAILIIIAIILYDVNVYKTANKNKNWNITALCIVTASWWLLLTAILGASLVFNFRYNFFPQNFLYYLPIHAHLGLAGWFLLIVMGVASKLIPLFLLSHQQPGTDVKIAYYCVNTAIIAFFIMAFVFNTEKYWPFCAVLVLIGVISYFTFIRKVFLTGMRRKKVDWPMKGSLFAIGLMILPFIFLAILASMTKNNPLVVPLSFAYGISILGGFITALIMGQTFKTLPFIVWMYKYKKLIGKMKTPLPGDLYKERWVTYQYAFYLIGIVFTIIGVAIKNPLIIRIGTGGLVVTAFCYSFNVLHILNHKVKEEKNA